MERMKSEVRTRLFVVSIEREIADAPYEILVATCQFCGSKIWSQVSRAGAISVAYQMYEHGQKHVQGDDCVK